jgi:transcriptional regulator with XRE-family HTH domain
MRRLKIGDLLVILIMSLARRIEERRIKLGLSREALAFRAKVAPKSIYNYEKGFRSPTVRDLQKIASALKTTMSWLIEEPFDLNDLPDKEEIAKQILFLRHRPDIREVGILSIVSKILDNLSKETQHKKNK